MPPSPFPVLNNKPIDQWKVTELKEELKRRKLPLRGLKDELVRRLDEALREEMNAQAEQEKAAEEEEEEVETPPIHSGYSDNVVEEDDTPPAQPQEVEAPEVPPVMQEVEVNEAPPVQTEEVEVREESPATTAAAAEPVVPEKPSPIQQDQIESEEAPVEEAPVPLKKENTESVPEEVSEKPVDAPEANKAEDSDVKMEDSDVKMPQKDVKGAEEEVKKPEEAKPDEQVSQLGPDAGSQLKCESISSNNESFKCINVENVEKNQLKDNLNADNFALEKQVEVKQDIRDDKNKPPVENPADNPSLGGKNLKNLENTPSNNVNSSVGAETGSPEKVNLDSRSSGDDSMEEDLTESNNKPPVESSQHNMVKEEVNSDNAPADTDKMDMAVASVEEVKPAMAASEKRKLEAAQEAAPNSSENFKRQRRWNSESVKVPEVQNLSSSSTPKDLTPSLTPKRAFNRSDSNASAGSPKERIVPPSQKPATNSLRIDKFVRPFTLKAVQELLGKTGSVSSFWMDHIKTHCYVTYSSVEEAIATREAVYNLQWPANGGNQLIAEFVDSQEVKQRLEAPPPSPSITPTTAPSISSPSTAQQPPQFSRQNSAPRNPQQQVQQLPLPPPPPLLPVRERLPLPPPPPLKKTDPQPAVVTLDDLFRKTKATPRIYYLPLSEETVAAKLAARAKAAKE